MKLCFFRHFFIERILVVINPQNVSNKRTFKKRLSLDNPFVYSDLAA